jgi:hypothetical protein
MSTADTRNVTHIFPPFANRQRSAYDSAECRQDNPTPPHARTASPQPAPLPHQMRPNPFARGKDLPHPGRPGKRKLHHTTLHLKPVVRADLERKAKEEQLSISATGAVIIEWFFQQSLYTQNAATLDTAIEKSLGRHMRAYSNRQASLQVRTLVKAEELYEVATNILGRQPGMNEQTLQHILHTASTRARSRLTILTPQLQTLIDAVKKLFEEKEVTPGG